MICTSECEFCVYGTIDESNRAVVKVNCSMKNKQYYYGQYVPCEYFEDNGKRSVDKEEIEIDIHIENIKPVKRKRGRPKGSKNKTKIKRK